MKKILLSAIFALSLVSCNQQPQRQSYNQNSAPAENIVVTPSNPNVGDNLDLQALGDLVKQSSSAQDIENKLNSSGSINNLDLDGDGNVDYIKVNETGSGSQKGFTFLVDTNGTPQQVAVITIEQANGVAQVNVQGNQDIYGPQAYYTSSHALSDLLIMNYLLSYHRPYYSPYHYGYYPRTYRSYRAVPYSNYHSSRVVSRTTTTRSSRPSTTTTRSSSYGSSSYKARPVTSATERTRALSAPTSSQKSFKVTSPANSRPTTSGFGSSRSSSSSYSSSSSSRPSSSSSYRSSSSSRPSSSSFGSSSRSSSSRSSSYGSSSSSSSRSSYSPSRSSSRSSSFGSSSRSSSSRSSRR